MYITSTTNASQSVKTQCSQCVKQTLVAVNTFSGFGDDPHAPKCQQPAFSITLADTYKTLNITTKQITKHITPNVPRPDGDAFHARFTTGWFGTFYSLCSEKKHPLKFSFIISMNYLWI